MADGGGSLRGGDGQKRFGGVALHVVPGEARHRADHKPI